MSGIYGYFSLDGRPVDSGTLEGMSEAMAYWGPDGGGLWHEGNVGLGQLMRHATPESMQERLPRRDSDSGIVITAAARLDNREELLTRLAVAEGLHAAVSDGELILRAYKKWGEDCVLHLRGDFAFAIWEARERRLFLAQCPCGVSSLYYHANPRRFAFASCVKALLAVPEMPRRPNLLRVAQVLTACSGRGNLCGYEGIVRLEPGHTLTIRADGQIRKRRYWFPETLAPLDLKSDEEYVEAFREQFTRAVRVRMRGVRAVGGTLSGGLDSGSVCALAARELRAEGRRLAAFCSVPLHKIEFELPGLFLDEQPLVEANRAHFGNLDVQYVRGERISPLAGFARVLEICDEPGHGAVNHFWIVDLLEQARARGIGVLLTGQFGNGGVSWTGWPESLWPDLLHGRWRGLWGRAKELQPTAALVVRRHLLRPILLPLRESWRHRKGNWQEPWLNYSAIRAEFARGLNLRERMQDMGHNPGFSFPDPRQERLAVMNLSETPVGSGWAELGAAYGLDVRDPTMDPELIEFCLRVPNRQFYHRGQTRWLLRRAMDGLLPDAVRLNPKRGKQAMDIGYRIRASAHEFREVFEQIERSGLANEVVDVPRLRQALDSLQNGINAQNTMECVTLITRGTMAGMFLLRFDSPVN